ncbi:hypothetical protein [Chengkuizengella sediminis]|uniref:hypothetical protein n=1 Tax=Chengkuizengella sediminis TaxID=1885917 RepID=UPI001389C3DE|nr:hypothetical protein [Chengkuizengella sediminis]NDI34145.1 hypothetical protein [Chengkuizengella sediminis]
MSENNINSKDFLLGVLIGGVLGAVAVKFLGGSAKEIDNSSNVSSKKSSNSEEPSEGFANNVTVKAKAVSTKFNDNPQVFPITSQSQRTIINEDTEGNTNPVTEIKAKGVIETNEEEITNVRTEANEEVNRKESTEVNTEANTGTSNKTNESNEAKIEEGEGDRSEDTSEAETNSKRIHQVKTEDYIEKLELSDRTGEGDSSKKNKNKKRKNK